jgi:hypothetical protein
VKILVTESQYRKIFREDKEQKILEFPSLDFFNNDPFEAWKIIQKIIEKKGNPPYSIGGNLYLDSTPIKSLGNLTYVGGNVDLEGTPIKSLGNLTSVGGYLDLRETQIKSLGNLQSVGGALLLGNTPIESLGNLTLVGGDLDLVGTPLSKMYTKKQIREMVNVGGNIYIIISDLL